MTKAPPVASSNQERSAPSGYGLSDVGHDVNVTQEYIEKKIGKELARKLKEISIALYKKTSAYAEKKELLLRTRSLNWEFTIMKCSYY